MKARPAWPVLRGPTARPARPLSRQRRELLMLYLGSLAGVLLITGAVVRGLLQGSEWGEVRDRLELIGQDLAGLPRPEPGNEDDFRESHKDFAAAHQQVEWFREGESTPMARLGERRNLGRLPPLGHGRTRIWQDGGDWMALVIPDDEDGAGSGTQPRVWLRVSEGLEPMHSRLRQLDLALACAVLLALLLSGVSAWLLTRRAVAPVERSLERLRQFSLDASHELRGPLAALGANAEMGLLEAEPGSGSQRRFESIADVTRQMEQLVEDLLLMARQDELRSSPAEPVDLSELLGRQLLLHQDGLLRRRLQLSSDIEPDLLVRGHPHLLERLFRNLLDNAERYNREGGWVALSAARQGGNVRIRVADGGVGLSVEHLPRVFDRFWRASSDRGQGGSGLGLAIAERICRSHGGRIKVTSESGNGSCFEVELPALEPQR